MLTEIKRKAVEAITHRNRLERKIEQIQHLLAAESDAEQQRLKRIELERLQRAMEWSEKNVELVKAEVRLAEDGWRAHWVDKRVAELAPPVREAARALLGEEQSQIEAAEREFPLESRELGKALGDSLLLRRRLETAEAEGDKAAIKELLPLIEAANAHKEPFEAAAQARKSRILEIRTKYARRLKALAGESTSGA